tara:strand:- start:1711 stop:4557 length:2847 start_codon:yes stop_codon:yes gene_type:complete
MNFNLAPINDSVPEIPNFTEDEMASMPSTSLTSLTNSMAAILSGISAKAAGLKKRAEKLAGIATNYLPSQGRVSVESSVSAEKVENSATAATAPMAGAAALIAATIASEGRDGTIIENIEEAGTTQQAATSASDKVGGMLLGAIPSEESALVGAELTALKTSLAGLTVKAAAAKTNLKLAEKVLTDRALGLRSEPVINTSNLVISNDIQIEKTLENFKTFVTDNIVNPYRENQTRFAHLSKATQGEFKEDEPMFNLTFGPPVSKSGSFILSNDGLYYDSVTGGIPEVSGVVAASSTWNLSYAPNLGGKGELYTSENLRNITDNVFDADYEPDSTEENVYYVSDDVLETFKSNKDKHVEDIYSQISGLIASGLDASSAMVVNYYGNVAAVASMYDEKIKKRKKQLQLASIYANHVYSHTTVDGTAKDMGLGAGILIHNTGTLLDPEWHPIERIPINDFSFLAGTGAGATIKQQESILLFSEDLDDTILPYTPTFARAHHKPFAYLENFSLSPVEDEVFPYINGEDKAASATSTYIHSLTTSIEESGLLLAYNFITPNIVDPSSLTFNVDNVGPDAGKKLDGQLVGNSVADVFPSGLAIPKLTGTSGGTYVRLPSNISPGGVPMSHVTQELDNLFYPGNRHYNPTTEKGGGVTFDYWVHVPSLTLTNSHRYRLIMGCENSGGSPHFGSRQGRVTATRTNNNGLMDTSKAHGMIIGFRDKGGTGATSSGLEFGVFPTVSQNLNDESIGHSIAIAENSDGTELGAVILSGTTSNGVSILDASASFVHMSIVFNYDDEDLKMYMDGELLCTSGLKPVFDLSKTESINIPSITMKGSPPYVNSWTPTANNGPRVGLTGLSFTPWILGGGFSDTILQKPSLGSYNPGFLGYNTNTHYGPVPASQHYPSLGSISPRAESGLDGFLGSFKVYSKALTTNEVKTNFKGQKGFFKNIKI